MPRFEMTSPFTLEKLEQMIRSHPSFTDDRFSVTDTAITIVADRHSNRNILLGHTSGTTATLPKAAGTGDVYKFTVGVLATAGNHIIKVSSTSDVIAGTLSITDTDTAGTVSAWSTTSTSDTVTMNRSTTGSVTKGEWVEVQDIANNTWSIRGMLSCTGTAVTPFSATV